MSKLGNYKRPAVVRVQTQARAGEILSLCDEHGWKVIVGIEPDKPEDISDVERLLNPPTPDKVGPEERLRVRSQQSTKLCKELRPDPNIVRPQYRKFGTVRKVKSKSSQRCMLEKIRSSRIIPVTSFIVFGVSLSACAEDHGLGRG